MMDNLLKDIQMLAVKLVLISTFHLLSIGNGWSQTFQPAMKGLLSVQNEASFEIRFITDGPMGKDWIIGNFLDEDSLTRCVAYREGGRWVPLPFSGYWSNTATDMAMVGDTLYIVGLGFGHVVQDGKMDTLKISSLLKYYNDSVWVGDSRISGPTRFACKGDSIIVLGGSYYNPPQQVIYNVFMTSDKGTSWHYPFSPKHPTDTSGIPNFGARKRIKILDNGDILMLNHGSPPNNPFDGIVRWDGQQWHGYGHGVRGGYPVKDFVYYKGELHIGGGFAQIYTYHGDTVSFDPLNPGNGIARWDGIQWQGLAGGVLEGGVQMMFVHNDVLYCQTYAGFDEFNRFGDAPIPYFAGWDGTKWCGTPITCDSSMSPYTWGVVNDTLFMVMNSIIGINPHIDGHPVSYLNYFDGDYLHGPNSICSTPGLGEEENELPKAEVEVFPNPANDVLSILLPQEIGSASYELLSLDGKLLQNGVLAKGENNLKINQKISGVFLLKVETQSGVVVQKVFFEN